MSTRSALVLYLAASFVIAAGSQLAVNALSFLSAQWTGGVDAAAPVAGAIFAPFALLALVVPLCAAPLGMRLARMEAGAGLRPGWTVLGILVLVETGTALARAAAGLDALRSPWLLHVLMTAYAVAAALLIRRRTQRVPS